MRALSFVAHVGNHLREYDFHILGRRRVSAAAATPVPIPVSSTANQKGAAPGLASVEGITSPGAGWGI